MPVHGSIALEETLAEVRTRYVDNSGTTLPERDGGTLDFYEHILSGVGRG
jgi:hypothetical protein